jgi:SAM-dependent methyltransferase
MVRLTVPDRLTTASIGGLFPEHPCLEHVQHILDVACGPGAWASELAYHYPQMQVAGFDISQRMVRYAQMQAEAQALSNVRFLVHAAERMYFHYETRSKGAARKKSWLLSSISGEREMDTTFLLHLLVTFLGMIKSARRANITKGDSTYGNDKTVAQDALWTEPECWWQLCSTVWPALSGWDHACVAVCLPHCTRPECTPLLGSSTFISRIRGNRRGDFLSRGHWQQPAVPRFFLSFVEDASDLDTHRF